MPYINSRNRLNVQRDGASTPGELNYEITESCIRYITDSPKTYSLFNEVIGAIESAKLEFYRRMIVPLEELKIKENGDVYN